MIQSEIVKTWNVTWMDENGNRKEKVVGGVSEEDVINTIKIIDENAIDIQVTFRTPEIVRVYYGG